MQKTRLEAFSDGVLAIIITIMVLELKVPHGDDLSILQPLLPFVTGWMGENHFARLPTALYGGVLLMAAIAYQILVVTIIREEGPDSLLAKAVGRDFKGNLSAAAYVVAIALCFFFNQWSAQAIYGLVALVWLVPDRRIERILPPSP